MREIWGLDEEGEVPGLWKKSGVPGIWVMMGKRLRGEWYIILNTSLTTGNLKMARFYSKLQALRE
jgi:hypothetical protein